MPTIQLDVEAFYVNARILLDRLSDFVHFCFRGDDNLSVQGFTNFRRNFSRFAAASNLTYASSLLTDTERLDARVVKLRDDFIVHNNNIRTLGATVTQSNIPGATPNVHFVKHKNGMWLHAGQTEDLNKLFDDVYAYVDRVLRLIDENLCSLRFAFQAEGYEEKLRAASRPISKATMRTVAVSGPGTLPD